MAKRVDGIIDILIFTLWTESVASRIYIERDIIHMRGEERTMDDDVHRTTIYAYYVLMYTGAT